MPTTSDDVATASVNEHPVLTVKQDLSKLRVADFSDNGMHDAMADDESAPVSGESDYDLSDEDVSPLEESISTPDASSTTITDVEPSDVKTNPRSVKGKKLKLAANRKRKSTECERAAVAVGSKKRARFVENENEEIKVTVQQGNFIILCHRCNVL